MDGKQMRGAKDVPTGNEGLYMVSAWAVEHGIVLGQRKVADSALRHEQRNVGTNSPDLQLVVLPETV